MRTSAVTVVAMALALAACGDKPEDAASGATDAAGATGSAATRGDVGVAAVLQSPGAPVAKLTFQIEARPVAGQPFALRLLASAAEALPELQVTIESSSLIAAPDTALLALDAAGTAVGHDLTVTAREEGLAELIVRLKAGAVESVYVVPLLVAPAATG